MLIPMNADEARDYIRTQLIQSHPSRAKNTDRYYTTLANEVADRLVDEVTVRKMAREYASQLVTNQVSGLARSGNAYLRRCADGVESALIEDPRAGTYLIKVPVFQDGNERPVFWNVRLSRATDEDLSAWANHEERKANEERDTRFAAVSGARLVVELMRERSCLTFADLQRRAA